VAPFVNREFVDRALHTLSDMQRHIVHTARAVTPQPRDGTNQDPSDVYDAASEERDREMQMLLTDRDRSKLSAIDEALARIREGSYGICEECEDDIAEGRLELLPFTRLCVTCQAQREREESQRRPRVDHGRRDVSLALGAGDYDEE
jgi:DnaK suppressor protein